MKSWNKESLLITVCVSVILVSVYALYRELTVRIDKNGSQAIGSITFKKRNAERKYAEYVIWEDIANNSPVYNYDSLRTFEGSAAYIRLNSGAEISLDEDTMIVLIADEKGVKINFDHGAVSAKTSGKNENISLNTKDVSISMNKGELAVKKSTDTVDVNVSSGEVLIDSGGGKVKKIDNNVKAQIVNGKTEINRISVMPEYPSDNTFFVSYKNFAGIHFRWKSESSQDETLQISKDNMFKEIAYSSKTSGKNSRVEIPAGDYYWRVVSGGEVSAVKKFILLKDTDPELIYPKSSETVSVTGNDEPVSLKWSGSEQSASYEIELAQDQNMEKPVRKFRTNLNSASVDGVPPGRIWWRVTRVYPENFVMLDNNMMMNSFSLERAVFTRIKPRPIHDGEMYASTMMQNIILNWEGGKGVTDYKIEISSDREFKNVIGTSSASMTFYNSGPLPEGKYYWRVWANYGKGESPVSETVILNVSPPKPVVYLYPDKGSILADNPDTVKLSWKDASESGNYLVEVSADQDFNKTIASSKTDNRNYILKNPGSGRFYWRVSIIDRAGSYIARGEHRLFIIPEILQKPSAIHPSNMGTINLDNTDVIKFQWEKVTGADSYELELFHRVSGIDRSLIVLNTDATKIEFRNFSILEPGTLVWVVRAKKSVKGKIAATSESERNYFILKVNDEIAAPKINVPGTIYVR